MKLIHNLLFLILLIPALATAAETPKKVSSQNKSGLYVTAIETYELMKNKDLEVVLVDIRDPIEIMFTGFTSETDIHVPFSIVDSSSWDPNKDLYGYTRNGDLSR